MISSFEKGVAHFWLKKRAKTLNLLTDKEVSYALKNLKDPNGADLEIKQDLISLKKKILRNPSEIDEILSLMKHMKQALDPEIDQEVGIYKEIIKLEKKLTHEKDFEKKWKNTIKNEGLWVIRSLEERYRKAKKNRDVEALNDTFYLIQRVKEYIDNELSNSIITGEIDKNVLLVNSRLSKLNNEVNAYAQDFS